jgi:hypothetical protein
MSIFDKTDDDTKKTSTAAIAVSLQQEHPEDADDGRQTVEHWGAAKKLLPDFLPSVGTLERRLNPDYWKFRAAKALRQWPDGARVTEEEFDQAVAAAEGHTENVHR